MEIYTVDDFDNDQFYKLQKFLFSEERYDKMSVLAKVAYSFLKDRMELSRKNNWIDDNKGIYLLYSRDHLCEMLKISKPTAIKVMKELSDFNLIHEVRVGRNKPNRIYIIKVSNCVGSKENLPHVVKNFYPSNTEPNKTELINNCAFASKSTQCSSKQLPYKPTDELRYFISVFEYHYEKKNGKPYIAHKPNKLREIDTMLGEVISEYVDWCNQYEEDIELEDTLSKMIRLYFNADMFDKNGKRYTHSIPNMLSGGFKNRLLRNVGIVKSYDDFHNN